MLKEDHLKNQYKDFSTRLSKAWGNQDLSQDDYDYQNIIMMIQIELIGN